jgi:hypothetical protein
MLSAAKTARPYGAFNNCTSHFASKAIAVRSFFRKERSVSKTAR